MLDNVWRDLPEDVSGELPPLPSPGLGVVRVVAVSDTQESEDGKWQYVRVTLRRTDEYSAVFSVTLFNPASPGFNETKKDARVRAIEALNSFLYATGLKPSGGSINLSEAVGKHCLVRIYHRTTKDGREFANAVFRGPAEGETSPDDIIDIGDVEAPIAAPPF